MTNEEVNVRMALKAAFPNSNCWQDTALLTHEDYLDMRRQIVLLRPEDVVLYLPCLLDEMINSHTDGSISTEYVESVVAFLDAHRSTDTTLEFDDSFVDFILRTNHFNDIEKDKLLECIDYLSKDMPASSKSSGTEKKQMNEGLKIAQEDAFKEFNHTQSLAILQWLELASGWSNFKGIWRQQLEGAIAYWKLRVARHAFMSQ